MTKKNKKHAKKHEVKENLIDDKNDHRNDSFQQQNGSSEELNEGVRPVGVNSNLTLNAPIEKERKRSAWAPVATATHFADVPVFTICPYCNQKVVTKTHFRRGRKNWYCCFWLPYFLDVFKDVIHTCPKCNTQISIYNRFFILNNGNSNASVTITATN